MASPKNSIDYLNIANCSRNTWCSKKHENIDILFCYGDNLKNTPFIYNDELHLTTKEDSKNLLDRTIEAFEFIDNNYQYDFILRTNISSYFNLELLYEKILTLPRMTTIIFQKLINLMKIIFGMSLDYPIQSPVIYIKNSIERESYRKKI